MILALSILLAMSLLLSLGLKFQLEKAVALLEKSNALNKQLATENIRQALSSSLTHE